MILRLLLELERDREIELEVEKGVEGNRVTDPVLLDRYDLPAFNSEITVFGTVNMTQKSANDSLEIKIELFENSDIANGKMGFTIHEEGSVWGGCTEAGGHYNPHGKEHGGRDAAIRHVGDLGNIEVAGNKYDKTITDSTASLYGQYSIIGRAFVLHSGEDDLGLGGDKGSKAERAGKAHLACGVIAINSDGYDNSSSQGFSITLNILPVPPKLDIDVFSPVTDLMFCNIPGRGRCIPAFPRPLCFTAPEIYNLSHVINRLNLL
eukprot:sb/3479340/